MGFLHSMNHISKPITMKSLLLLCGMLAYIIAPCQTKHTADELAFQHAVSLYEDGRSDDALLAFYEFMNVHPKSHFKGSAHFNIGYLQYQRQHYDAAAFAFRQILEEDYNEQDANNIMEPYMLYKHQSCRMLAEISLQKKEFREAEEYIRLFEKVYPYQHFCGNELSAYAIYLATMKARVYEGQGKISKAIQTLVPYTFSDQLASNDHLLELLINILFRNYDHENIKLELTQALASITVEKKTHQATITLFGKQVSMREFYFEDEAKDTDVLHFQQMAKENMLFKRFL